MQNRGFSTVCKDAAKAASFFAYFDNSPLHVTVSMGYPIASGSPPIAIARDTPPRLSHGAAFIFVRIPESTAAGHPEDHHPDRWPFGWHLQLNRFVSPVPTENLPLPGAEAATAGWGPVVSFLPV